MSCSPGLAEQNIRSVQYDNNIYYMVTKTIEIGEELLTYYGDKQARKQGVKVKKTSNQTSKYIMLFRDTYIEFRELRAFQF